MLKARMVSKPPDAVGVQVVDAPLIAASVLSIPLLDGHHV